MSLVARSLALLVVTGLAGCPAAPSDPPPPPRKAEIPTAPPRALGAMAAGTDAAPRPERGLELQQVPSLPLPPGHLPLPQGGPDPGGDEEPAPDGLAPGDPDAGMAL